MVTGKVDIYNLALAHIGAERVSSISGTDEKTVLLNSFYQPLLDKVLRLQVWGFAIERQVLAADTGDNYTIYAYKYQLPEDPYCLKPLCLLDSGYADTKREEYPWEIENRYLYSDVSSAILKYIGRPSTVTKMDSDFVIFFAAYLAAQIAFRITGDREIEQKCYGLTDKFYREAIWNNADDTVTEEALDLWTEARNE
jgi:hypothetical protein